MGATFIEVALKAGFFLEIYWFEGLCLKFEFHLIYVIICSTFEKLQKKIDNKSFQFGQTHWAQPSFFCISYFVFFRLAVIWNRVGYKVFVCLYLNSLGTTSNLNRFLTLYKVFLNRSNGYPKEGDQTYKCFFNLVEML